MFDQGGVFGSSDGELTIRFRVAAWIKDLLLICSSEQCRLFPSRWAGLLSEHDWIRSLSRVQTTITGPPDVVLEREGPCTRFGHPVWRERFIGLVDADRKLRQCRGFTLSLLDLVRTACSDDPP